MKSIFNYCAVIVLIVLSYEIGNRFDEDKIRESFNVTTVSTKINQDIEEKSVVPQTNIIEPIYPDITADNFIKGPFYPSEPFTINIVDQTVPGFGAQSINILTPMTMNKHDSEEDISNIIKFENYLDYPVSSLTYITNDPNTFVILMHSGTVRNLGPLPAETLRRWAKYIDPFASIDDIISINQNENLFKMKIIDLKIIKEDKYLSSVKYVNADKPEFFDLTGLGISAETKNFRIIFVFCVEDVNSVFNKYGLAEPIQGTLTNNRGLLVLEYIP